MKPRLNPRYSLLTAAYLATIYRLSSIPDLSTSERDPLVLLVMNLGHIPLFAGLAFCVWKSLSSVGHSRWVRYALALGVSGACGVLDEWHQSFVPGRCSSVGDVLLDLAGIGGMLLVLFLHALGQERRRARDVARLERLATSPSSPSTPCAATGQQSLASRPLVGSNPISRTGGTR